MLQSLKTRIQNSLRSPIKEKLFFLHIPKCGGSSVSRALKSKYLTIDPRRDTDFVGIDSKAMGSITRALQGEESAQFSVANDCVLRAPECLQLYFMQQEKIKCIAGHVPFSEIAYRNYQDQYKFITVLRDPIERWVSEFYFSKQNLRTKADMSLTEYIESKHGQAQGTQYVLFLGGRSNGNDHSSREAVQRAIQNLSRFTLVGFLNDLAKFEDQFQEHFSATLKINRSNVTRKFEDREQITTSVRQQIETICERDLEIFHQAKRLFP